MATQKSRGNSKSTHYHRSRILRKAMIEVLESRIFPSLSAIPITFSANQGVNMDGGNLKVGTLGDSSNIFVGSGANTTANQIRATSLTVNGNLTINSSSAPDDAAHTSIVQSLSIASGGTLDLGNNALIIRANASNQGTILGQVTSLLSNAYYGTTSPWHGAGITSSVAAADPRHYALGLWSNDAGSSNGVEQEHFVSFAGQTLQPYDIIIAFTASGDANMLGPYGPTGALTNNAAPTTSAVDFSDFIAWSNHNGSNGNWSQGDFNYDGGVNFADFIIYSNDNGASINLSSTAESQTPLPPNFVGSFTDNDGNTNAAHYTASITWGDGSNSSTGGIVYDGNGTFDVFGGHTYLKGGTFNVSVIISDDDGDANATIASTANVADGPLTGSTINLLAVQGRNLDIGNLSSGNSLVVGSGVNITANQVRVGNLTVNGNLAINTSAAPDDAAHTSIVQSLNIASGSTLDLGNNSLIIRANASNENTILGQVTSLLSNAYWGTSSPWHGAGITSSAAAADSQHYSLGLWSNDAGFSNGVEQKHFVSFAGQTLQPYDIIIAFTAAGDSNMLGPGGPAGSTNNAAPAFSSLDYSDSLILSGHMGSNGNWSQGDSNYDGKVDFADFVINSNDSGGNITFPLSSTPAPINPTPAQYAATFTDGDPLSQPGDFVATINWGDGSSSSGAIASDGNGGFHVLGDHTYSASGSRSVQVTVSDTLDQRRTATFTNSANVVVPPTAPTLSASVGSETATLTWTSSTSPAGGIVYSVYRNPITSTFWDALPVGSTTSNTFVDSGLIPNTNYTYTVIATDANGVSTSSTPLAVTSAPPLPSDVTMQIVPDPQVASNSDIQLNWDPISIATGYAIYRSTSPGQEGNTPYAQVTGSTTFTDTGSGGQGIPNGNGSSPKYYYEVVALNSQQGTASDPSFEVEADLPTSASTAAAPTNLTAGTDVFSNGSTTTLFLTWAGGITYTGSSDTHYIFQASADGISGWNTIPNNQFNVESAPSGYQRASFYAVQQVLYYRVAYVANGLTTSWSNIAASGLSQTNVVELSASVHDGNSPSIQLQWPLVQSAQYYKIYRQIHGAQNWGMPVGTASGTSSGWTDSQVTVGTPYQYQVVRVQGPSANTTTATGMIYSGIDLPVVSSRGGVLLVVDSALASTSDPNNIRPQITQLTHDLVGDGWSVSTMYVSESVSAATVKSAIATRYHNNPQINSIFLIGHVAVPYTGDTAWDGHYYASDPGEPQWHHEGPWPSDAYYGDINGTWNAIDPNASNNFSTYDSGGSWVQENGAISNTFTNTTLPLDANGSAVQLSVGRVDFAGMTDFALDGNPADFGIKDQERLIKQYLDKDHAYRQGLISGIQNTASIMDGFGSHTSAAAVAWNDLPGFVGTNNPNLQTIPYNSWFATLGGTPSLWAYGSAPGQPGGVGSNDIGFTTDFASPSFNTSNNMGGPSNAIFNMIYGSFLGDWNLTNDELRGVLANNGDSLGITWGGTSWLFQPMQTGGTIGQAASLTFNSDPGNPEYGLLGDPTLTAYVVQPPSNLSAADDGNSGTNLTWIASSDPNIAGYLVYANSTLVNTATSLVPNSGPGQSVSYNIPNSDPGATYMVRAVKLINAANGSLYSHSGTFYMASEGAFTGTVQGSASINQPPASQPAGALGQWNANVTGTNTFGTASTATAAVIGANVITSPFNAWTSPSSLLIDLNVNSNATDILTLHIQDGSSNNRSEVINIFDKYTNQLLSSTSLSNFSAGQYLQWSVSGQVVVQILNGNSSPSSILSGIYLDPS
jgi:hypothetical protein